MKILINNSDLRKYRQIGKQVNADDFNGKSREIQENQLTELLGEALSYDFFNYLDNDWDSQEATFVRNSDYQFTATEVDLSSFVNYALKINDEVFVIVKTATLVGYDTVLTVEGYELPETIVTLKYKSESNYIKLLNGTSYIVNSNPVKFNGLRPFICWHYLALNIAIGNVKHSDVGVISLMPENRPNGYDLNASRSTSLQNALREYNRIVNYLNENEYIFPLWDSKNDENITNLEMIII